MSTPGSGVGDSYSGAGSTHVRDFAANDMSMSYSPQSPGTELSEPDDNVALLSSPTAAAQVDGAHDLSFSAGSQASAGMSDRVFPIRSVVSIDPTPTPTRYNGAEYPGLTLSRTSRSSSCQSEAPSGHGIDGLRRPKGRRSLDNPPVAVGISRRTTSPAGPLRENYWRGDKLPIALLDDFSSLSGSVPSTNGGLSAGEVPLKDPRSNRSSSTQDASIGDEVITARFSHIVTSDGHAVITGRDGDAPQRCEDEPIHIPGAVQGFGLLIALREEAPAKFVVRIASENSERIIGYSPKALFALENFCDILSPEQADNLIDHIEFIKDGEADPAINGPEVFIISVRPPGQRSVKLWCAIHTNFSNPDLIICEFELDDDPINPLFSARDGTPEAPENTLDSHPTAEEFAESTSINSKPLRVLRSARKRRGEAAAMDVFNIMSQVQEQLASAPTLELFLKVLVGVVKELTGFHRVMIYQFDQDWNGRVVTELVDPRATGDLFKGLSFPASDIPKQARDLYKINKVRLLYDRDQPTARLVCRTTEDLETPLDLTYSYLRAMSPVHLKYLANMAVRASMSISINSFDELWGLIACHSYGSKGMRVSFPIRKMCRLVGDSASRNIERLSYASRLQARKLINTAPTDHNPSGYIVASSDDLIQLFDADFGLLAIRDETKILGKLEHSQEALAMLEYLRLRQITSVMASQDIREDFPDLRYKPGFQVIAGLLLIPLSVSGDHFIVFFRKSQIKHIHWAGNPYHKVIKQGTEGYLEPRRSFKTWTETVMGKSKEWTEEQFETAAVLCLVYGKFISVWRQKEAAVHNTQLTRLLLANSAHEVRTPLNAIINYLEIALEGSLDSETREHLSKSHSASKSLICVINDLLDLTKAEEGMELVKEEMFNLPATVREASTMFAGDAQRKEIKYEVEEAPGFPEMVLGDQRRVRQIVSNIIANAIEHTSRGSVKVGLNLATQSEKRVSVDIVVEDTGSGMSPIQLDALFRELEQVQSEDGDPLAAPTDPATIGPLQPRDDGKSDKRTLGLGLAVVGRLVRNMEGQLRLKSEEGKGSRFVVELPFILPDSMSTSTGSNPGAVPVTSPPTPSAVEGEMMLIDNTSPRKLPSHPSTLRRHGSADSKASLTSVRSHSSARSVKSDADRLIDAIQEPCLIGNSQDAELTRRGSRKDGVPDHTSSPRSGHGTQPSSRKSYTVSSQADRRRSTSHVQAGTQAITDSISPLKSVKIADPCHSPTRESRPRLAAESPRESSLRRIPPTVEHLHVLVAEDDPINSKIMKKRLQTYGHEAHLTVNGEECASMYGRNAIAFDVILMDMQV